MAGVEHILLATDLTDRSDRALARAVRLCPDDDRMVRLTLLHVVLAGLPSTLAHQQQTAAEDFLTNKIAELHSHGLSHTADLIVRIGDPFSTVIAESMMGKADLVVIGTPARDPYAQTLVGTTAGRIIRFSARPVLLVKRVPDKAGSGWTLRARLRGLRRLRRRSTQFCDGSRHRS